WPDLADRSANRVTRPSADAVAPREKDPFVSMPLGCGGSGRARQFRWTSFFPLKPMVRSHNDDRVLPLGGSNEFAEDRVDALKVELGNLVIPFVLLLCHLGLLRWRKRGEDVADGVGPLEVHDRQVRNVMRHGFDAGPS